MEDILKNIIADILSVKLEIINDEMTFENTEAWDSLKHMEMIAALEEEFEIEFTADEIVNVVTYVEIKKVLVEKGVDL